MDNEATELVRVRPRAGAEARLRALRPQMVAQYERHWPGAFRTELYVLADGTWLDIWTWESREVAEDALAHADRTPAFEEWLTLVEPISFDWASSAPWGVRRR